MEVPGGIGPKLPGPPPGLTLAISKPVLETGVATHRFTLTAFLVAYSVEKQPIRALDPAGHSLLCHLQDRDS